MITTGLMDSGGAGRQLFWPACGAVCNSVRRDDGHGWILF
jgi:hypothetical protein